MAIKKEVVEEIKKLKQDGLSVNSIVKQLKVHKDTVYNVLNNVKAVNKIDDKIEIILKIKKLKAEHKSRREIAEILNLSFHQVKNFTYKMSLVCKSDDSLRLFNMKSSLRYNVSMEWLEKYSDNIDKLTILNAMFNHLKLTDETYKQYIEYFWNDNHFNTIYKNYVNSNYESLLKPSLDHIIPKSKGGSDNLENLRITTWFENRARNNISIEQWATIKQNINKYLY